MDLKHLSFISDVTDKILPQIEDWQNRPLDEVYQILYIDAIHYSVRDNGVIRSCNNTMLTFFTVQIQIYSIYFILNGYFSFSIKYAPS